MNKEDPILTDDLGHLKYALKAKDEFLANVSHELRAPLNSIIGFSEVLVSDNYGALNDKQRSYAEHILKGGRRLLALINNVLEISKMDALKTELVLSEFPVSGLLQDVMILMKEPAFKKDVTISHEIGADIDKITADYGKIKHALYSLLSNAVKFTPRSGGVNIYVRRSGSGVEIEVSDTGIGIAPEDLTRVFEAFPRIGNTENDQGSGTGLSLAISKKAIEMHGGKICAESKGLDQGARFKFTLPCAGIK